MKRAQQNPTGPANVKLANARAHRELGECKRYLMNHMGLYENDSMYYCKVLGGRWRELVGEEELYAHK